MWNQLRMYFAEKLLYWGMLISPNNSEGEAFKRSGLNYFEKLILNNHSNGE